MLRFLSSQPWAPERHATWPAAFRTAVRTLLCCAHREPPASASAGIWSLPLPLLQRIVELLASSRFEWLPREAAAAAGGGAAAAAGGGAAAAGGGAAAAAAGGVAAAAGGGGQ